MAQTEDFHQGDQSLCEINQIKSIKVNVDLFLDM